MSNMRRISSGALLAAAGLFLSGPTSAQSASLMVLPAASGFAYDVSKTLCFPKDEPGRVHYKGSGCGNVFGLWHVALPNTLEASENRVFEVYAKDATTFTNNCYATINAPSGQALRWDDEPITNEEKWYQFDEILVNPAESILIECEIINTTSGGTSWMGAAAHWGGWVE